MNTDPTNSNRGVTGATKIRKNSPIKLAHVVLKTRNFAAMREFYLELLSAQISYEDQAGAFITYDDEHHRVALLRVPTLLPRLDITGGIDHYAFTFATLADLLDAYERVTAMGIKTAWCTHHGGTISIYYRDPDSNIVETQVDVFQTIDEANAFLSGDDFRSNPLGVDFDPDDWLRRIRAGENEADFSPREVLGYRHPGTMPRAVLGNFSWAIMQMAMKVGIKP